MRGSFRVRIAVLGAMAALALGALAAPASSAGLSPPVADCNAHGRLTQSYTSAQLRNALATMSADIAEYTNCHDVIQRQLLAQIGGKLSGGSGGGGGSFLPTWLLIVLIVLVLAGVGFGVSALQRRRGGK
jgi:hypothetical protein